MAAPSEAKLLETYLKDIFSRPFLRRFRYLYFGLQHAPDVFVLSDTEDVEFKYCEPMQATGLVKVHNREHYDRLLGWFARFGLPNNRPMLFYFDAWLSLLSKQAWDTPDLTIQQRVDGRVTASLGVQQDILLARPVSVHFTLIKLQATVDCYQAVFFDQTIPSYDHPLVLTDTKYPVPLRIGSDALVQAGILDTSCQDAGMVLIPGIEALMAKSLLKKDMVPHYGLKVWADAAPRCLSYGGYCHTPDVSLCAVRDNIFLFPLAKGYPDGDRRGSDSDPR